LIQKYQKIKAKRIPPALPTHNLRCKVNSFIFHFPLSILDLSGSAQATWLREALRWKARKGGSRWGRGGKKASL
jgi:hypothetical protein